MIAGDTVLMGITPAVGLYPDSRPDPLGDYLETLARIEELAPRVAYAGHGAPVPIRRAARGRSPRITTSGSMPPRLRSTARRRARTRSRSRSSTSDLPIPLRRFATAESLAHLERLVALGRAERADGHRYHSVHGAA